MENGKRKKLYQFRCGMAVILAVAMIFGMVPEVVYAMPETGVEHMEYMFQKCCALKALDLSSFDTSSVTDMSYMFYGCSRLTSIDLSSFNVESVGVESDGYYETGMDEMFEACIALKEIHTPKNVPEEENVLLPGRAVWYDANNNQYTQLPKETDSIVLKKAEIEGVLVQDTFGDIEWKIDTHLFVVDIRSI